MTPSCVGCSRRSGGLPSLIEQLARPDRPGRGQRRLSGRLPGRGRSHVPTTCSTPRSSSASDGSPLIGRPVGLDVLADVCGVARSAGRPARLRRWRRRSLVEVGPDGRFDMLPPMREVGLRPRRGRPTMRQQSLTGAARLGRPGHPPGRERRVGGRAVPVPAGPASPARSVRRVRSRPLDRRATRSPTGPSPSLSAAMRAREALDMMDAALASGDGPPIIGSQLARRAGICASEVRGTYEGLRLLDRSEEHAARPRRADAGRRAGPHRRDPCRDAPRRRRPRRGARRRRADPAPWAATTPTSIRQVRRTLMDVCVSAGDFGEADQLAALIVDSPTAGRGVDRPVRPDPAGQGRLGAGPLVEAASLALFARTQAQEIREDRIALLADTVLRAGRRRTGPRRGRRDPAVGGAARGAAAGCPRAARGR